MPHLDTDKNKPSGVVIQGKVPGSKDNPIPEYDSNIASNIGFTQISNIIKDYKKPQQEEKTQNE